MRTFFVAMIASILSAAVGFWARGSPSTESRAAPSQSGASPEVAAWRPGRNVVAERPALVCPPPAVHDDGPLRRRIESLEQQLRNTTHELAARKNPYLYTPRVDFPQDGPDQLRPDGFHRLLEQVMEQCKDQGLSLRDVDCSEYPCVAWTQWNTAANNRFDLSRCKPWHDAFGDRTSMMAAGDRPDAGPGSMYAAFYAVPEDLAVRQRLAARMHDRLKAMLASYGIQTSDTGD